MSKKTNQNNQQDLFNSMSIEEQQINSERNKNSFDTKSETKITFSAIFQPTTLFSLKESNSTNKGAKSVLLPSPYAIKMALLNQIITIDGLEKLSDISKTKSSKFFNFIRDVNIDFHLSNENSFVVNNSFIKILDPKRPEQGIGFKQIVVFREFVFIKGNLEFIFTVKNEEQANFLKQYIHKINYFGKRGSFFQFIEYRDDSNEANIMTFDGKSWSAGVLQSYDNFDDEVTFEQVNNYSATSTKRKQEIKIIPVSLEGTSKGFSIYKPF